MSEELKQCETGCGIFYGGERRHHKDCVFYPDSLSEMMDKKDKQLASAVEVITHYADKATWYRCDSHINLKYELEYHSAYNLSGENGYDKAAEWLKENGYE